MKDAAPTSASNDAPDTGAGLNDGVGLKFDSAQVGSAQGHSHPRVRGPSHDSQEFSDDARESSDDARELSGNDEVFRI